jgi:hypothetical protein
LHIHSRARTKYTHTFALVQEHTHAHAHTPTHIQIFTHSHTPLLAHVQYHSHTYTHTYTFVFSGEAQPLRKAPQWMKRPCGVSFGFGGRLVSFANHKTPVDPHHGGPGQLRDHGTITVSQVRGCGCVGAWVWVCARTCARSTVEKEWTGLDVWACVSLVCARAFEVLGITPRCAVAREATHKQGLVMYF